VVVLGSASEGRLALRLAELMKHDPIDLTGRTTLGQLAEVLRRSRLALTLESAPSAVAIAVGTPTLTLFGSMEVWIRGQQRGPAVGIRKCGDLVPTCYTTCKLAKMERAIHRCESDECIGGDGLTPIAPADVLVQAKALMGDVTVERAA
jgi:ADP-heptose:LPS heptosyltransferase